MHKPDLKPILAYVMESQGREIDPLDLEIWWDAIQDMDATVALDAVRRLVRESGAFITPALVRQTAQLMISERLELSGPMPRPPSGLDAADYLTWYRSWRHAIATGSSPKFAEQVALESIHHTELAVRDQRVPRLQLNAPPRPEA